MPNNQLAIIIAIFFILFFVLSKKIFNNNDKPITPLYPENKIDSITCIFHIFKKTNITNQQFFRNNKEIFYNFLKEVQSINYVYNKYCNECKIVKQQKKNFNLDNNFTQVQKNINELMDERSIKEIFKQKYIISSSDGFNGDIFNDLFLFNSAYYNNFDYGFLEKYKNLIILITDIITKENIKNINNIIYNKIAELLLQECINEKRNSEFKEKIINLGNVIKEKTSVSGGSKLSNKKIYKLLNNIIL